MPPVVSFKTMAFNLTYLKDISQGVPASNFAAKGCLNPQKIYVYDNVLGKRVPQYVNCGHCLRCADSKREEFVSRMFLHALDFKNVYFITLTYGSYNLNVFEKHPFKDDWLLTHPVCDSFNSTRHRRWTPTLVIQSHVTKFFKRLRKAGFNFSYVAAGELGSDFCRPHHHIVIYTNDTLTIDDVRSAWSYICARTSNPRVVVKYNGKQDKSLIFRFPIGRVDFNDLYANGSMDWANPVSDTNRNAKRCFNYVAKYICKVHDNINSRGLKRLKSVYNSLETITDVTKRVPFNSIAVRQMKNGAFGADDWISRALPVDVLDDYADDLLVEKLYTRSHTCANSIIDDMRIDFKDNNNPLNPKCYETKKVLFNGRWLESCDFDSFVSCFSQYFTFSRSSPIGGIYFEKKCSEFEKGNFALPEAFGKTLAFPSYYYSLLARKKSPFCFRKNCISGTTFVKGNLSLVYEFYSRFIEDKSTLFDIDFHSLTTIHTKSEVKHSVSGLIDPYNAWHGTLLDISFISHNQRIHYYYDFDSDFFNGFVFNRHTRTFDFHDSLSRIDMCLFVMLDIERIFEEYSAFARHRAGKNKLISLIKKHPDSCTKIDSYIALRKHMDKDYISKHLTKDFQ